MPSRYARRIGREAERAPTYICIRCGAEAETMRVFCALHLREYQTLVDAGDLDEALRYHGESRFGVVGYKCPPPLGER